MLEHSVKGRVDVQIYKNEQSGFGIYRIVLFNSNQKPLTIKGTLFNLEKDAHYEFFGNYKEDKRYGMQFDVSHYERMLPQHRDFIIRFLSGPNFPGVGEKTATSLVDKYGDSLLEDIRNDESMIMELKGVSSKKMAEIIHTIRTHDDLDDAVSFLLAHGLSNKQIVAVNKVFGDRSIEVLRDNPYRLVSEVDGVGFKTADKMAHSLGFDFDHPYRIEALVLDKYKDYVFSRGDSYIEEEDFLSLFIQYDEDTIISSYHSLLEQKELVLDEGRLYHRTQYDAETHIASFMTSFEYEGPDFELDDFDRKIAKIENKLRIEFDDQQKEAIERFFTDDILVLTGGPGTGKSTLLSGVVSLMQENMPWLQIAMCAPTGRAAKRLEELTNVQASTIHSLLNWDLEGNVFGRNEENPLDCDVLIVDEFSMVDTWLLHNLLKASSRVKKFLFVGDKDQLPSVGPGFVLGDLIESQALSILTLERNYRQEAGSEVIDLAMNMNKGQLDLRSYSKDVSFYSSSQGSVKDIVLHVVAQALSIGYDISEVQVLAPMYAGSSGIDNLNHFLQKMCNPENPQKEEIHLGTRIFREGDKILQLKNQPDDFVFNGDIGTLIEVSKKEMLVDFDGIYVSYEPSDFINITHAYCMSVHKAQGSEYPVVILIAVGDFWRMLSRRLYYTGATRSSKQLILVGSESAFKKAVDNHNETHRLTFLKERLVSMI